MNDNVRSLVDQLSGKGVPLERIPACIRDLGSMVADGSSLSLEEMNQEMRSRGWQDFHVDEGTLILVLLFMTETLIDAKPDQDLWFEKPYGENFLSEH